MPRLHSAATPISASRLASPPSIKAKHGGTFPKTEKPTAAAEPKFYPGDNAKPRKPCSTPANRIPPSSGPDRGISLFGSFAARIESWLSLSNAGRPSYREPCCSCSPGGSWGRVSVPTVAQIWCDGWITSITCWKWMSHVSVPSFEYFLIVEVLFSVTLVYLQIKY
jgi:hypothetical protein